ncbi:GMC family oxidoreductase [Anaerolineales bacterium]
MPFLNQKQRHTLSFIIETFAPRLSPESGLDAALFQASAADYPELVNTVEECLEAGSSQADLRDLRLLFSALEQPFFNLITAKKFKSFSNMDAAEREALLLTWGNSPLGLKRKAFQNLKKLSLFCFYAHVPSDQVNQTWQGLDYQLIKAPDPVESRPIQTFEPTTDHLTTQVLVVGSGAGGGVIAGELAAAGFEVLLVEKGAYFADSDFHGRELDSHNTLFEKNGLLVNSDASILILAGSTLGGGTAINWSASFQTPPQVLEEWATEYGFTEATSPAYQASLKAVSERVNVNTAESIPNPQNAVLERGCQALGYHVDVIPRNVKDCEDCGFCGFGCQFGAKQSTTKTYIQDAYANGARILVGADTRQIIIKNGEAKGAILHLNRNGQTREIQVDADLVVVSAGAIHTPALLQRSGLKNPHIGANLHLHPVVTVFSRFPEKMYGWLGVPMARVSKEFSNLDGQGFGIYLETAPSHPGIIGASMPWASARGHRQLMNAASYMANLIILTRDKEGGHVRLDAQGEPVIDYKLHPYDEAHMLQGMLEGLKVQQAAGAETVFASYNDELFWQKGQSFPDFIQKVKNRGIVSYSMPLFSAHQMSSCRIAGDAATGALKPTGETYEVRRLYVADASAFPSASGVNPMISVLALSHFIAQQIKANTH